MLRSLGFLALLQTALAAPPPPAAAPAPPPLSGAVGATLFVFKLSSEIGQEGFPWPWVVGGACAFMAVGLCCGVCAVHRGTRQCCALFWTTPQPSAPESLYLPQQIRDEYQRSCILWVPSLWSLCLPAGASGREPSDAPPHLRSLNHKSRPAAGAESASAVRAVEQSQFEQLEGVFGGGQSVGREREADSVARAVDMATAAAVIARESAPRHQAAARARDAGDRRPGSPTSTRDDTRIRPYVRLSSKAC